MELVSNVTSMYWAPCMCHCSLARCFPSFCEMWCENTNGSLVKLFCFLQPSFFGELNHLPKQPCVYLETFPFCFPLFQLLYQSVESQSGRKTPDDCANYIMYLYVYAVYHRCIFASNFIFSQLEILICNVYNKQYSNILEKWLTYSVSGCCLLCCHICVLLQRVNPSTSPILLWWISPTGSK